MVSYQSLGEFGTQSFSTRLINRGIGISSRQTFSIAYPKPKTTVLAIHTQKKRKETTLALLSPVHRDR